VGFFAVPSNRFAKSFRFPSAYRKIVYINPCLFGPYRRVLFQCNFEKKNGVVEQDEMKRDEMMRDEMKAKGEIKFMLPSLDERSNS